MSVRGVDEYCGEKYRQFTKEKSKKWGIVRFYLRGIYEAMAVKNHQSIGSSEIRLDNTIFVILDIEDVALVVAVGRDWVRGRLSSFGGVSRRSMFFSPIEVVGRARARGTILGFTRHVFGGSITSEVMGRNGTGGVGPNWLEFSFISPVVVVGRNGARGTVLGFARHVLGGSIAPKVMRRDGTGSVGPNRLDVGSCGD